MSYLNEQSKDKRIERLIRITQNKLRKTANPALRKPLLRELAELEGELAAFIKSRSA